MNSTLSNLDLTAIKKVESGHNFLSLFWCDNLLLASKISSIEDVEYLKSSGVTFAIDLKEKKETPFDDEKELSRFGIRYYNFPVTDIDQLGFDQLNDLKKRLENEKGNKLIYCMSGNRVGALLSLILNEILGHPKQRSYDFAMKVGVTKEPLREKLRNRFNIKGS